MNPDRKSAIIAGVLFIVADLFGVPAMMLSKPLLEAPDYLIKISTNLDQMNMAIFLVLIMSAACAGIAIAMYPVLKRYDSGLALGAVGFRIIEAIFEFFGTFCLLLLMVISQEFVKAGALDSSYFQTLGTLLLVTHDYITQVLMLLAWGIAALIYSYVFYRSKLIPRWLSGWGLVVYPLLITASILTVFDLIIPLGTIWGVLVLPAALHELVLAVWLIAKGYNTAAIVSETNN